MQIITIANQKGGVGKSTTALELCYNLPGKILGIDMDPQGSFTKACGAKFSDQQYSLEDVLLGNVEIEKAIQKVKGIHVLASSRKLADSSKIFTDVDDIFILQDILKKYMQNDYDYVIIDSAPGRSPLLNMAYVASNFLIIPSDADIDSLEGIDEVIDDIEKLTTRGLTQVKILGTLLVAYEKTAVHDIAYSLMNEKAERVGTTAFNTKISKTVRIKEAKTYKLSLSEYEKESHGKIKAAKDYKTLTKEVIKRIKQF